jgi:hypothetical protein
VAWFASHELERALQDGAGVAEGAPPAMAVVVRDGNVEQPRGRHVPLNLQRGSPPLNQDIGGWKKEQWWTLTLIGGGFLSPLGWRGCGWGREVAQGGAAGNVTVRDLPSVFF